MAAPNLIRIRIALMGEHGRLLASPMAEMGEDPSVFVTGGMLEIIVLRRDLADPKAFEKEMAVGGVGGIRVRIGRNVVPVNSVRKDTDGDWVLSVILPGVGGQR
jgi:hypothetical protein